jgi:hypothetical protein
MSKTLHKEEIVVIREGTQKEPRFIPLSGPFEDGFIVFCGGRWLNLENPPVIANQAWEPALN